MGEGFNRSFGQRRSWLEGGCARHVVAGLIVVRLARRSRHSILFLAVGASFDIDIGGGDPLLGGLALWRGSRD